MNTYRAQVEAAIRATVVHSPITYSWFGKRSQDFPPALKRALTPQTSRDYLHFTLQAQLYEDFYCKGMAVADGRDKPGNSLAGVTPFVESLAAANSGTGYQASGWQVRALGDGAVLVRKEGLSLRARREDCGVPEAGTLRAGEHVTVRFPKESLGLSPGFYLALGNEERGSENGQPLVRLYWHLTAPGAVRLMRCATSLLNQVRHPFKLKVLNDPAGYSRCDAAVLYIRKCDFPVLSDVLATIHAEVAGHLRSAIPALTKPLASGLGLAEDPGRGESFGLHRCGLLADGMIRAHERGRGSLSESLKIVARRFVEEGLSLEEPFLNPRSTDAYSLPVRRPTRARRPAGPQPAAVSVEPADPAAFLRAALAIGRRLSQEAIWYRNRCNWLGDGSETDPGAKASAGLVHKALGPELYSGTSGVALFLAELYAATGDPDIRRTALGAIRQALSQVSALRPPVHLGLYTGWTGIAFVATRVGALLEEEATLYGATRRLLATVRKDRQQRELDLLSGSAGTVAALVALNDDLGQAPLLDFAARLGEELLDSAEKTEHGYSWPSIAFPHQRNLTGFSHGTAGMAYALLELSRATGEPRFADAAEQAFRYERHGFDAEARNWPDFRQSAEGGAAKADPPSFSTSWCHGAPGIALSRLRAYELTRDETRRAEAVVALQTTRRSLETSLRSGIWNFSLCHGLAGNAEVLLCGAQVLGKEAAADAALARKVARVGLDMHAARGGEWPCGNGGQTPGLMVGLAGIGHFYLRLHDPAVPSILLLRRECDSGKAASRRPLTRCDTCSSRDGSVPTP